MNISISREGEEHNFQTGRINGFQTKRWTQARVLLTCHPGTFLWGEVPCGRNRTSRSLQYLPGRQAGKSLLYTEKLRIFRMCRVCTIGASYQSSQVQENRGDLLILNLPTSPYFPPQASLFSIYFPSSREDISPGEGPNFPPSMFFCPRLYCAGIHNTVGGGGRSAVKPVIPTNFELIFFRNGITAPPWHNNCALYLQGINCFCKQHILFTITLHFYEYCLSLGIPEFQNIPFIHENRRWLWKPQSSTMIYV